MVKSGAERTALHRIKKAASDFSAEYLVGVSVTTPEDFISAKEAEFCVVHNVAQVSMSGEVVNSFYELLKNYNEEDGLYVIEDLIEAYKEAYKTA